MSRNSLEEAANMRLARRFMLACVGIAVLAVVLGFWFL